MRGRQLEEHVLAEALFASDLQPDEDLSSMTVVKAVNAALRIRGEGGCAAVLAYEYGEHPETAVRRMSWAICRVYEAYSHQVTQQLSGRP